MSLNSSSDGNSYGGFSVSSMSLRKSPVQNTYTDLIDVDDLIDELIENNIIEDYNLVYDAFHETITYTNSSSKKYFVKVGKTVEKKKIVDNENIIYDLIDTFSDEEKKYFIQRTAHGTSDKYAYCILQYIDGMNLYDYIANLESGTTVNYPSPKELYTLLLQITKALDILLKHGFIHGDFKMQNIYITDSTHSKPASIKLFDFELTSKVNANTYTEIKQNMYHTRDNPTHGYLYICKTIDYYGKGGIYKDISKLVSSRDFDAKIYKDCIEIIQKHLDSLPSELSGLSGLTGGRRKRRTLRFRKKTLRRR